MKDELKTKEQLIDELAEMCQRIAELEASEAERKRTEEALRESEERYHSLVRHAPFSIWICDGEGTIIFANQAAQDLFGVTDPAQIVGRYNIYHDATEAEKPLSTHFEHAWAGQVVRYRQELDMTKVKYGTRRRETLHFYSTLFPIPTSGGRRPNIVVVQEDITEQMRAEEEIRKLNQFLDSVIDNANVWLNVLDEKADVVIWNRAAEEISGYSREEVVGHGKIWEWLYPDEKYRNEVVAGAIAIIEKGEREQDAQTTIQRKDGQARTISWNSRGLMDEKGKPIGSIALGHDITERRQAEEEIQRRTAQLEALREVGLELTAQLDLDNLLRSIVSRAVELLGGNSGALDLYRPDLDVLEWTASVGMDPPSSKPVLRRGEGLCGRVWETGEPLIVDDYHHWEGRRPGWEGYPFKALMGVPVRWGGEFLGVLQVSAAPSRAFSQADAELLNLFATQAAIAIRNARLYEETQRRALEQETVSRIAYALNTPDVRDAFPVLVEGLRDLTGCDAVNLLVLDEAGEQFITSVLESPFPMPGEGDVMLLSATAAAEDVGAGRPHLTADLSTETGFPFEQALYQAGLRSQVALPLLVGGEVFGALTLGGSRSGLFREEQLPVLRQIADAVALSLENSLLFQAEREQRELAESLEEAAAIVSSTLDPEQVLERILEQVSRVVPNDAANIMLIKGDQAHVVRWRGYERFGAEEVVPTVVFRIAEVPGLQEMLESGEPIVIPDTTTYPGWVRVPATEWLRSYAAAPIIVRGEVIGFLNVDSVTPGFFAQAHAEALRVFADHAAAAIENARLFEEEKKRSTQLALINEVGDKAASILDLDKLIHEVTRYIEEKFNYYNVALFLLDEERREVVMQAVAGGFEHIAPGQYRQSLDEGIIGFVTRAGKSWLTNDISKDPYYVKGFLGEVLTRSELCVPVKLGDKVIGALDVQSIRLNDFDQEDVVAMDAVADRIAIAIENARLYDEAQKRAEEMAALHRIGLVTTSTLDLDEVLELIYEQVSQLMKPDTFYIALYDKQKEEMNFEIYVEKGQYWDKFSTKLAGGGLTSWIIQSNQPLLVKNTAKESWPTEPVVTGEVTPEMSYLGVPLLARGKVIGVISVQSFQPYVFDEGDQRFLSAIANQAAIAIENARLFEETRQRALQLQTVEVVGRRASAILDLEELLPHVAKTVQQSFGYYHVDIFLVEPGTGYAVFKASNDPIAERIWKEQSLRFKIGEEGMVGWVAHTGEPLLANDVSQEPHYSPDELLPETKSELVVPLKVEERVVGVLDVNSDKLDAFDENDIFVLQTLAGQISIAIENARLYEETQRQSERLAQTLTLSEMLHGGLELEQVLKQIAQGAVSLGFQRAVINVYEPEEDLVRVQAAAGLEGPEREELMGATYRWSDFQAVMQERFQVSRSYLIRQGEVDWEQDFQGVVVTINSEDRGPGYWRPEDMLLVPLWGTKGKPAGLLSVDEPVDGLLPDLNTIQTLEAFANQAAIAIENARLFGETERLKAFNESVVQGVAEAILIEDAQGILTFANPAAEELLGYTCEELIGLYWVALTPEEEVEKVIQETAKRPQGMVGRYETVLLDKKGQRIPVIVSARPLFKESEFVGVLSAFTDIRKRVQAEREIEERRMYLEGVLGAAPDAIVTTDARHRIVEWNSGAERLFGYSHEEAVGQNLDDLITNPDVFEEAVGLTQVLLDGMEVPPTEVIRYRKDGSHVHVIVAGSPILVGGDLIGLVAVYTDITQRKRMEEALRASLLVDELTSLYNRRGFSTLGQQQLKTAHRAKTRMSLLFADFDELKGINDTLGHQEGDLALIEIANALRETFRESDIIARIGGDEFVVLVIETDGVSAENLTSRLQQNLEARNARGDRRYKLSLSMGIARYDPEHPCSIDELLAQADRLMYEQKQDTLES
jgi:diguanylate cyclase (GGDEF)-like protein/PAS domain S-box-containing protein